MRVILRLIALLALASCEGSGRSLYPSPNCTLIGCAEHLVVTVTNAPNGPWTVDAVADTMTRRFTCAVGSQCPSAMLEGYFGTPVTITITVGERSTSHVVSPAVTTTYPNGERCLPACRRQSVTLAAP